MRQSTVVGLAVGAVVVAGGAALALAGSKPVAPATQAGQADANGWTPVAGSAVPAAAQSAMQGFVQSTQASGSAAWQPYSGGPQQPPVGVTNVYGPEAGNPQTPTGGPFYALAVNGTTTQWYSHP